MRIAALLPSAAAFCLLAAPAGAFEYSLTAGGNGYVPHIIGTCADKACTSGALRMYQDCDVKADPRKCPVSGVGTFEQVRPGCYHNRARWTMKDGRIFDGETFKTADGAVCSPG